MLLGVEALKNGPDVASTCVAATGEVARPCVGLWMRFPPPGDSIHALDSPALAVPRSTHGGRATPCRQPCQRATPVWSSSDPNSISRCSSMA